MMDLCSDLKQHLQTLGGSRHDDDGFATAVGWTLRHCEAMKLLGVRFNASAQLLSSAEQFVCTLYGCGRVCIVVT